MVQPAILRSGSAALQSLWSRRLAADAGAAAATSMQVTTIEGRNRMGGLRVRCEIDAIAGLHPGLPGMDHSGVSRLVAIRLRQVQHSSSSAHQKSGFSACGTAVSLPLKYSCTFSLQIKSVHPPTAGRYVMVALHGMVNTPAS